MSWSLGGLRRGLSVDEGMLLLETVGLCALFRPKANVGENVFGLVNHDDWSLVQAFAKSLVGEEFRVLKAYLQNLVPMPRSRVFLLQGVAGPELPRFRVALGETAWMLSEADQALFCTLTNRERELLSARALLPDSLKFKAPSYTFHSKMSWNYVSRQVISFRQLSLHTGISVSSIKITSRPGASTRGF